jgi:hypothetical protein
MLRSSPLVKLLAAAALCLLATAPAAHAQSSKRKATITVVNDSDWAIYHLYMTEHDSEEWGPDQLGEQEIDAHGGTFTMKDVPCLDFDVELVDEHGDTCEIEDVDVCGGHETWRITNRELQACQGWGK